MEVQLVGRMPHRGLCFRAALGHEELHVWAPSFQAARCLSLRWKPAFSKGCCLTCGCILGDLSRCMGFLVHREMRHAWQGATILCNDSLVSGAYHNQPEAHSLQILSTVAACPRLHGRPMQQRVKEPTAPLEVVKLRQRKCVQVRHLDGEQATRAEYMSQLRSFPNSGSLRASYNSVAECTASVLLSNLADHRSCL